MTHDWDDDVLDEIVAAFVELVLLTEDAPYCNTCGRHHHPAVYGCLDAWDE
jgi:hypothetical protein